MEKAFKKEICDISVTNADRIYYCIYYSIYTGNLSFFHKIYNSYRCPVDWAEQLYCGIPG